MPVYTIDTLKPKNEGDFPIVEAADVAVSEDKRLSEALTEKADASALAATNEAVTQKADRTTTTSLQSQIDQIEISASAEAVVAPEVAGARVSDENGEYSTLKERLEGDYSNLDSRIVETTAGQIALEWEANGLDIETGEERTTSAQWRTKGYTQVRPGEDINFATGNSIYYFVCWYNENKEHISSSEAKNTNRKLESPATAKYMRLCGSSAQSEDYVSATYDKNNFSDVYSTITSEISSVQGSIAEDITAVNGNITALATSTANADTDNANNTDMASEAISTGKNYFYHRLKSQGVSLETGLIIPDVEHTQLNTDVFYFGAGKKLYFNIPAGYYMYVLHYSSAERSSFVSHSARVTNAKGGYTVPTDYIGICFSNENYTTIPLTDADKCKVYTWTDALDRQGLVFAGNYNTDPISVDTNAHTITFSSSNNGYASLVYGNKRYDLKGKTVDYSSIISSYGMIYFNLKTEEFFLGGAGVSIQNGFDDYLVYIGAVWLGGNYVDLNVLPFYTVNGVKCTMHDNRFNYIPNAYRMAVLGDSISTYVGVSEDSQSGTVYEIEYYPKGTVDDVSKMWWEIVRKGLRFPNTPAVSAISRSSYRYQPNNPDTIPYGATDARIERLAANGTPTHIFLELGMNDPFKADVGTNLHTVDVATLDASKEYTYAGCAETICKIQNAYPNAKIIVLIPKTLSYDLSGTYSMERQTTYFDAIKEIAEQLGVYKIIDLRKCGINQHNVVSYADSANGIHPTAAGMQLMADYIIDQMIN